MTEQTNITDFDIIIIGGGLAGASLAVALSSSEPSLRIAIVEAFPFKTDETAYSAGDWICCGCSLPASGSTAYAYWNGVTNSGTADTYSHGTDGSDGEIQIGTFREPNVTTWRANGDIAEVALWNAFLSDEEHAALAAGYSPLFIQPHNFAVLRRSFMA